MLERSPSRKIREPPYMPNFPARHPRVATVRAVRRLLSQLSALFLTLSSVLRGNASNAAAIGAPMERSFQRRYKATAYISLLSVTIFSHSGVGFGFAGTVEYSRGAQQSSSLGFLSGSTPERAYGLNRFGFIHENVEQTNRATVSAKTFSVSCRETCRLENRRGSAESLAHRFGC